MAKGKCREMPPDTFFPSDGAGVEVARRICADCPMKSPCLEYALANHIDHGVWGGTSVRERRRIARRRRLAAAAAAAEAEAAGSDTVPTAGTAPEPVQAVNR
jgi:WhiB family redox-sensing transcriptional regulator